jgi:hypothetical protein
MTLQNGGASARKMTDEDDPANPLELYGFNKINYFKDKDEMCYTKDLNKSHVKSMR